jgi:hypothetical protein
MTDVGENAGVCPLASEEQRGTSALVWLRTKREARELASPREVRGENTNEASHE